MQYAKNAPRPLSFNFETAHFRTLILRLSDLADTGITAILINMSDCRARIQAKFKRADHVIEFIY